MRQAIISERLDVEKCGDTVTLDFQPDDWRKPRSFGLNLVEAVRLRDWLNKELGK